MNNRIEELEKQIDEVKNLCIKYNLKLEDSSLIELHARLEERKQAEKEFLELIDNCKEYFNHDMIQIEKRELKQKITGEEK